MKQPLIDLTAQYQTIKDRIDDAISRVLKRTDFILGQDVRLFEQEFAQYIGVKHAIGVASGTDALVIALAASGIGPGDEVITSPFTFIATAEAIQRVGARIVFADIDRKSFTIDPKKIAGRINQKTKAIIPVHLYGEPCAMDEIHKLVSNSSISIIEDCAQSLGAVYNSKKVGSIGRIGCFSFFPGKNLGCYGDGGIITTNDTECAERIKLMRNHGSVSKYEHVMHGYNSRLDTIQAAVLRVKLPLVDQWNEQRRAHADGYRSALEQEGFTAQFLSTRSVSSMNYFTIYVDSGRDELQAYLKEQGIASAIYYPQSLHVQKVFADLGYKHGDFPEAEYAQERVLSLPMYAELTDDQRSYIINEIKKFKKGKKVS
ncbi:MAG: hypothetical protein GF384_05695 [Elusimicrobia bacterium]|nr:hypothetical protein [Elusimicrobiota bacterium]MBD3412258.1 hypothetical protein [Elusimicrobiota bacterium]